MGVAIFKGLGVKGEVVSAMCVIAEFSSFRFCCQAP